MKPPATLNGMPGAFLMRERSGSARRQFDVVVASLPHERVLEHFRPTLQVGVHRLERCRKDCDRSSQPNGRRDGRRPESQGRQAF